ncbi:uncharacterized protein MONOS_5360 [Monocercomonoides exilis]|uniref:uncharacterized protein n=1 Tax=Monocercomonoides exilis TaxID=2049356 RepID=UPI0035599269|nr:hypothetical protein MONOS_5360 [Monocercomonoides exilis]|eukprot:MONOS_5360.1-p1 / transcript=MONOS_5360.1 / gene=MONOS_5360 / organism=Monocercomonoides_exilis_PA203 / gene_product=unspecified product / transcript_product=unspecified product / location=Mono_scaffold00155:20055-22431(+) / protein_length=595 / sequence_SO=supercontig / SO=protein_coding / is_pseudo=false
MHTSTPHASSLTPRTSSPSALPYSPPTLRSQHTKTPAQPNALSPLVSPSHSTPALLSSSASVNRFSSASASFSTSEKRPVQTQTQQTFDDVRLVVQTRKILPTAQNANSVGNASSNSTYSSQTSSASNTQLQSPRQPNKTLIHVPATPTRITIQTVNEPSITPTRKGGEDIQLQSANSAFSVILTNKTKGSTNLTFATQTTQKPLGNLGSSSSSSPSSSSSSSSFSYSPTLIVSAFASVSATALIFPAPAITQTTTSIARTHLSTAHRSEISTSNTPFSTTFALATLRSFFDDTPSSVFVSLLAPTIVLGGSSTASIASSSSSSSSSFSLSPLSSSASSSLGSLTSPKSLASSSFSALLSFSQSHRSRCLHPPHLALHSPDNFSLYLSLTTSQQSLTQESSPSRQSQLAHPGSFQQSAAVAAQTASSNLPAAVTSSAIISTTSSSSLSSAMSAPLSSSATYAPQLLLVTYSLSSHTSSQKRFFRSPPRLSISTTPLDDVPPPMPSSHSLHKCSSSSHQEMRRSMEVHKHCKANDTSTSMSNLSEHTHLIYCSKQVLPEMYALRLMKREKKRNVTDEIFEMKRMMRRRNRHSKKK